MLGANDVLGSFAPMSELPHLDSVARFEYTPTVVSNYNCDDQLTFIANVLPFN